MVTRQGYTLPMADLEASRRPARGVARGSRAASLVASSPRPPRCIPLLVRARGRTAMPRGAETAARALGVEVRRPSQQESRRVAPMPHGECAPRMPSEHAGGVCRRAEVRAQS